MDVPSQLVTIISRNAVQTASPAVSALMREILTRHGDACQAIIFYGSCLRTGDEREGLIDLYLLVDDYRNAYRRGLQALLNTLLPPNVYYLELDVEGGMVRTKYAVLSLEDFQNGTSMRWFHSYLWGRFCQPAALLYIRNESIAALVQRSLAQAAMTFVMRVLPQVTPEFKPQQLWCRGFELSYRAELRAEQPGKLGRLFDADPEYYKEITRIVVDAVAYPVEIIDGGDSGYYRSQITDRVRFISRFAWRLRFLQGKLLSILRLLKAMTTFEGGVDYILWKIKRHSGVTVDVNPRLKRHPLLAMWVLSWKLYRKGGFR